MSDKAINIGSITLGVVSGALKLFGLDLLVVLCITASIIIYIVADILADQRHKKALKQKYFDAEIQRHSIKQKII